MKVIRSTFLLVFVSSTIVAVSAICPYQDKEGSLRRKRRTAQVSASRTLQWGSQHPDFTSLLSAADYYSSSVSQPGSTATVAVSSEGTQSVMNVQNGDWIRYSLGIPEQGEYTLSLRISSTVENGSLQVVAVDTRAVIATFSDLPWTGDMNTWTTVSTNLTLPVGQHMLEFLVVQGGWSLQWLNLVPVNRVASPVVPAAAPVTFAPAPTPVAAPVTSAPVVANAPVPSAPAPTPVAAPVTTSAPVVANAPVPTAPAPTPVAAPVTTSSPVVANAPVPTAPAPTPVAAPVTSAPAAPATPSVVIPMAPEAMPPQFSPVAVPVAATPSISPMMAPAAVPTAIPPTAPTTPASTPVAAPLATPPVTLPVTPMLPPVSTPEECKLYLDASAYASMSGVNHDNTTDYVGWLDPGDWIVYNVPLPPGTYQLDTTAASPEGKGSFLLVDAVMQTPLMLQNDMPVTGDWLTWQVASTVFALPTTSTATTAPFQLEMRIYSNGWNLKSLCFRETTAAVPQFQVPGPPTMEPTALVVSRTSSDVPVRSPHDCSSPF